MRQPARWSLPPGAGGEVSTAWCERERNGWEGPALALGLLFWEGPALALLKRSRGSGGPIRGGVRLSLVERIIP